MVRRDLIPLIVECIPLNVAMVYSRDQQTFWEEGQTLECYVKTGQSF